MSCWASSTGSAGENVERMGSFSFIAVQKPSPGLDVALLYVPSIVSCLSPRCPERLSLHQRPHIKTNLRAAPQFLDTDGIAGWIGFAEVVPVDVIHLGKAVDIGQ